MTYKVFLQNILSAIWALSALSVLCWLYLTQCITEEKEMVGFNTRRTRIGFYCLLFGQSSGTRFRF